MVAVIKMPENILKPLNYNENKLKKGVAQLIVAENFLKDADQLNFKDKLQFFKNRMELHAEAETKLLHISINFHPSEKLAKEQMIEISRAYMEKLGFAQQPYLIYQHFDAAHPHLHIVTTLIRENGTRIPTHNIAKNKSIPISRELEKKYGLVVAGGKNLETEKMTIPAAIRKLEYGKSDLKRSITNVLDEVLNSYKYTSLQELNAILEKYNVRADPGAVGGRINTHKGLLYHVLKDGKPIGVPIKASSIYSNPILKKLELKFKENKLLREPDKRRLKGSINWVLSQKPSSIEQFASQLKKERIDAVAYRNEQGIIYGISFIDYRTRAIFKGSDLGANYSSAALLKNITENLTAGNTPTNNLLEKLATSTHLLSNDTVSTTGTPAAKAPSEDKEKDLPPLKAKLLEALLQPGKEIGLPPSELQKKKKKKRRPHL